MQRFVTRSIETSLAVVHLGAVEREDGRAALVAMHFKRKRMEKLEKRLAEKHNVKRVRYEPMSLRPVLDAAALQLDEFLAGERREFALPMWPVGTAFQQQVWTALCAIPFGTTISYRELAERVENPKGSQAVGQANGANPLAVIVPCHRVIASDGTMAGYAGGEDVQRRLIDLEAGTH